MCSFSCLVLITGELETGPKSMIGANVDSLFLSTAAVFQILLVKAGIFLADAINRAFPYLSVEACFYAIPFATAAMLVAVLTNRNMALVLSIFISFIISFLFENNVKMSLFCFLGSVASSYHVVSCRQRSAFFNAGLFLGLFNAAVIFCLGLISKEIFSMELLIRLAMGMVAVWYQAFWLPV
jgi:membrane-associated HD superfamily phosphohydrolase